MSSELNENNMELDTPLKKRLYQLMTDEEKRQPFSFATRIDIGKSTFHNIWTKGSTSIHRGTAKKIADATGVDVDWLHKGIGEPYKSSDTAEKGIDHNVESQPQPVTPSLATVDTDGIDMQMMIEALTIVDNYLSEHHKRMAPERKAELVVAIYDLLCKSPEAGSTIATMLKFAV